MSNGLKLERIQAVIEHMLEHDNEIALTVLSLAMDMLLSIANDKRLLQESRGGAAMMPLMVKMVFDMNAIELDKLKGSDKFVKDAESIANEGEHNADEKRS